MPEPLSLLNLQAVPDDALLRRLAELTRESRRVEVDLVAHIAEADARRLYAREACSSMFDYCRQVLRLRENEAYLRITVARASREHPQLLAMLGDGRLHLSGIATLARHLTLENRDAVLSRAAGLSHRGIKELARELDPLPDAPAQVRKLPERRDSDLLRGVGELGAHRVRVDVPEATLTAAPGVPATGPAASAAPPAASATAPALASAAPATVPALLCTNTSTAAPTTSFASTGRGPVHVRRRARQSLPCAEPPGVPPSRCAIRARGKPRPAERPLDMQDPQSAARRARIRSIEDGPLPSHGRLRIGAQAGGVSEKRPNVRPQLRGLVSPWQ